MVLGIILSLAGLFSIVCSIGNYEFFFTNSKAVLFVKLFGRNGARIFYILLGLFIISVGMMGLFGIISLA